MIASWMLYCAAVSMLLGFAALSLELALSRRGLPLRWVWIAAIGGSLAFGIAPWFRSNTAAPAAPRVVGEVDVAVTADPMVGGGELGAPAPARNGAGDGGILPERAAALLRPLDPFLLPGWAVASMSALLLLFGAHRRLVHRRRRWRTEVLDGFPVLVSSDVGPAVVGFMDTAIVLPEWVLTLDPERRRLVLAHERAHQRAGDPALLLGAFVASALMPWNAPLWWQVRRLRHAVELDCDARVLHGTPNAAAYGELLIDVGAHISIRRLGLAAFAESSSLLAARIRNLTAPRPRGWRVAAGGSLAVTALVLAVACDAPTPAVLDRQDVPGDAAAPAGERPGATVAASTDGGAAARTDVEVEHDAASAAADGAAEVFSVEQPADPSPAAGAGAEYELELITRSQPNIRNIRELIRLLHPEVYRDGLPLDRALWLVVDLGGRIRESWVGPNLYINFQDGLQPQTWLALPEGSPAERRAKAEHQRAVQQVLDAHVPGIRIRARYAAHSYVPVPITLHLLTEAPGTPAWGGRDTLATEVVIRTTLPISGEELSLPAVETVSWRGLRWNSVVPARIIDTGMLERVGEMAGKPIFADGGLVDPEVIYRLEMEPNVFLPFRRAP